VLNDLGREAMAAVAERSHADILPDTPLAPRPGFRENASLTYLAHTRTIWVDIDRRSDHPIELD
jgi:hypothetical protein